MNFTIDSVTEYFQSTGGIASRWWNDSTNTVGGYTNPWFTKDNSASGVTTFCNDSSLGGGEPAKTTNDSVAVYYFYWDGDSSEPSGVTRTREVKSKVSNALGLYDMSGNVYELCFD